MEEEKHELTEIAVKEVSLVGKPAIGRKWLLLKSEDGMADEKPKDECMSTEEKDNFLGLLKKFLGFGAKKEAKAEPEKKVKETKEVETMAKEDTKEPEKIDVKKSDEYIALAKERDDYKGKVDAIAKAERKRNLEAIAKELSGKPEDNLTYLEKLADSLPEDAFKMVIEREKLLIKQVKEGELFKEKGKTTQTSSDSPEAKLKALAKAEQEKSHISYFKAYDKACKDNPEIYKQVKVRKVDDSAIANEEK